MVEEKNQKRRAMADYQEEEKNENSEKCEN